MKDALVIKHYKGSQRSIRSQFERETKRLGKQGYGIESQQVIGGRRGVVGTTTGVLLLGFPFLFTHPKDELVVTYRLRD